MNNIYDFLSGQVYHFVNEKTAETYFSNKKEKVNKKETNIITSTDK